MTQPSRSGKRANCIMTRQHEAAGEFLARQDELRCGLRLLRRGVIRLVAWFVVAGLAVADLLWRMPVLASLAGAKPLAGMRVLRVSTEALHARKKMFFEGPQKNIRFFQSREG